MNQKYQNTNNQMREKGTKNTGLPINERKKISGKSVREGERSKTLLHCTFDLRVKVI